MSYDAERIKGYLTDVLQSPPIIVGEYELWIETQISMSTPAGGWISITGGEPSRDYAVIFKKKESSDKVLSSFYSYRDALNAMAILIRAFEITQGVELPEIKGD
jgi:hypothetical protein